LVLGKMALASKIIGTVVCVFLALMVLNLNKFVPPTLRRDASYKLTPPLGETGEKFEKGPTSAYELTTTTQAQLENDVKTDSKDLTGRMNSTMISLVFVLFFLSFFF
jgi:hypothetical protein